MKIIETGKKGAINLRPFHGKFLGLRLLGRMLGRKSAYLEMRFNLEEKPVYLPVFRQGEDVLQAATAEIILAHELIHADHLGRGIYKKNKVRGYYILDDNQRIEESLEEIFTVGLNSETPNNDPIPVTENDIRGEIGMFLRNRYYEKKDIELRQFDIQGEEVQPNQPIEMIMDE